ncbi:Protein of unknown function [Cotesia congregata]|uniref:Uncharacterized protein n=1 Tax=Cotesia congregata TaxID=51543 RepID=A0A8J2HN44_COTCN|nr:Protein of unknown function [Cotesia congregata]
MCSINCELELTKQDEWVDSKILRTKNIPIKGFKISAYINYRSTHMNVKISKSDRGVVAAIAEMTISDMPSILRDITGWRDTYHFNELPLAIHLDKCPKKDTHCDPSSLSEHKYSIKINCSITWFGFISDDNPNPSTLFKDRLRKFWLKETWDIILKVGEYKIHAYKMMLVEESKVYLMKSMLLKKCYYSYILENFLKHLQMKN